jgi:ABC-type glycerol-3-phosphate transport system substrate-binding protein
MRIFMLLMALLLLAAGAAGCASKAPADSDLPTGVIRNPVRPDPEAIKKRKLMLIAPQQADAPPPSEGNH